MALQFYLNDKLITCENSRADRTVLDFLREEERLKGTKEGCAEGDCGACTVLIGRVQNGVLTYRAMNACIAFLPMIHGAHLVTIESLSADGALHWIQQALIDHHGSQCGFCTPGIIMSLYGAWMNEAPREYADWQTALQGNLCRCTGYAPILRAMMAAEHSPQDDPLIQHREEMREKLSKIPKVSVVVEGDAPFFVPATMEELEAISAAHPNARLVAGATDIGLWVTKGFRSISPAIFMHHVEALQKVEIRDDEIHIGAMVTYQQAANALQEVLPDLHDLWLRIAGAQIRNMGTLGGNIANGSPIGDTPPIWIALAARIVLNHGGTRREIPIEDYFIDYGKQDRRPGEFLETIIIPREPRLIQVTKISKRRDEDISTLLCAIGLKCEREIIRDARIAYGGMAAIPKRAKNAEAALLGSRFDAEAFQAAAKAVNEDLAPISDMRASAEYRSKMAGNLLLRAYKEWTLKHITT